MPPSGSRANSIPARRTPTSTPPSCATTRARPTRRANSGWRVVEIDPDYPDADRMVANCERASGELESARRRLEGILQRFPRDVDALADLGYLHEEREEWQSALKIYERALEVDPRFARVRARMAGLLQQSGRESEALEHLLRASSDDPGDAHICEPLAHALNRAGRGAEAERVLRRAVRFDRLDAGPRCARARYHEMTGEPARAAADYKRASILEPNDASHLCGEARACIAAGGIVRGRARLEYAVARYPEEPGPYLLLADLALAQNDARDACAAPGARAGTAPPGAAADRAAGRVLPATGARPSRADRTGIARAAVGCGAGRQRRCAGTGVPAHRRPGTGAALRRRPAARLAGRSARGAAALVACGWRPGIRKRPPTTCGATCGNDPPIRAAIASWRAAWT